MPKKFPAEFKRDVVTVARRGDLSVAEVAVDFGVSEESVRRWMRQADIDDGIKDGLTSAEQAEVVQLRRTSGASRWRTRSSGVLRRTSPRTPSQKDDAARPGAGRRGILRFG
jgi:transposase